MFFGAGNLIFPPYLAYEAGRSVLPAFIGFIATAIGLPVLSLIAIGKAGATEKLASRVHPVFAAAFTIAIYLAIGPCLAIPRTASTSYEMVANALPVKGETLGSNRLPRSAAVAVGPEGGFTPQEEETAQSLGWTSALLGPRVLRTETAGLAAAVWLQTIAGDFPRGIP